MLIEFYGHSDDTVCWRIDWGRANRIGTADSVGCYQSGDNLHHCTMLVTTIGDTAGVKVHAIYDSCWSFAVGLTDEDRRLPNWTFDIAREHGYSTKLVIDTGDEPVTVTRVEKP